MITWLLFPRKVDPDNPWARRLLRLGPGGKTKTGRREPAFRSAAVLIWVGAIAANVGAPAVLALAHAPFSGYRRRRRLMNDPRLPELLQLPRDPADPAIALRASVERWSRRMALLALLGMLLGFGWIEYLWRSQLSYGEPSPRQAWSNFAYATLGAAWFVAACCSWWAGCHMRASVIAAWPRLWLAKALGLAGAAALKFGVVYFGGLVFIIINTFSYHGSNKNEDAFVMGVMALAIIVEVVFFFLRLSWAEAAWRGAEASLSKELTEAAAQLGAREVEE